MVEVLIKEMKLLEYTRKEIKEVVCSGIVGWKRKIKRREQEGGLFYRSAVSTLPTRCRKKLTEKTNLYGKRKANEEGGKEHSLNMGRVDKNQRGLKSGKVLKSGIARKGQEGSLCPRSRQSFLLLTLVGANWLWSSGRQRRS